MKYPQLVSSNAISAISDWLVYKLDELGVDAPIILVFSRFLLSLLANHADSLDVRREAVESLKQVSSSVDNKETKIAQLVDQLHSKLKKIEEETTLTASISFEPFSNREHFQQTQKEQTIVEEDPKKKYYMAFPALDKNGNSDDCVSKTMPKSLNWSSIINIRSDKRHPIQTNKKLKSKRKRNFGRGKFESHKKNVNEPEPILWDMDFLGKGAWEMSADLYGDEFISKYNQVNKTTLEASPYDGHTNNQTTTNQNNLLEYNERSEINSVAAFASTMDMPRSGGRDAYYDYDDEDDDEKRQTDRKNDNDPFEISDSFCDSQNLKQLKSKFDSKVRALWDDQEDDNEFRFHDSENIIQNLAISLQLLQNNNNNNCGAGVSTSTCGKNHFYNAEHRPEQTTAHDFIKYGTNLNYSIWSDSVSVISANQSVWEQSGHDEKILCNDADKSALEWPDLCVMEVLHSIDVVATQPIYEYCGHSAQLDTAIEDSPMPEMATATRNVQIPLVEVTLPNHSANSRFSEVVPSFFREACSGQPVNPKSNVPKKPTDPNLQAQGAEFETNENLLTSEHTHFRPIKFPISPYIDGYSFRISSSPIKLEDVSRSETGSLYIDTKKYMEYKKTNADPHSDPQKLHGTNKNVEEFFIKFQVKQNEKFCQTESEYSVYTQENPANVPQSLHDTDVGFWRMDNSELQQEPCINDPVNGLLKAETDLDGDEIMSDLSFIQNLYIGNDWNSTSHECVDTGPTNETTNDYYDHNYEYNIVYDLLKPETTKTLKKMLNQQVMLPNAATTTSAWTMIPNDEPSNTTMADDYRFMEDKLNRYNNSIRKQTATAHQSGYDNAVAESCGNGRRKRRYSECRKDKLHYYESVKVLPFVQDSVALENFITCKFWTTNLTIFNPNENDNYSESLLIGLGSRPMTR